MKEILEYFVYAIFVESPSETLVKIGRGASVRERISGVRTGCPYPITRVYSIDVGTQINGMKCESDAHELHARRRLEGEWFSPWGKIASQDEIEKLERDLLDIVTVELGGKPLRAFNHSPTPFCARKVRMVEKPLMQDEKLYIRDPDGYPVVAPYLVGNTALDTVPVVFKRRRFQRH